MGDHDHGGSELFFELVHQFKHLGLYGHVQGGGGFVGDEKGGIAGQSDGDDHALFHAAGELMGVSAAAFAGYSHEFQHVAGAFQGVGFGAFAVQFHHFGDLFDDGNHGIQRGHGILKDHGDLAAANGAHLAFLLAQQAFAFENDVARLDLCGRNGQKAHNAQSRGGLAGSGLAHKSQGFALGELKVQSFNGVYGAAFGDIVDGEIFDLEEQIFIFRHHKLLLSVSVWDPERRADRRPGSSEREWSA